jgi:hypothetical protein
MYVCELTQSRDGVKPANRRDRCDLAFESKAIGLLAAECLGRKSSELHVASFKEHTKGIEPE